MSATPENTWRKALLPADATVQQAIRNLDDSALQIALVVSPGGPYWEPSPMAISAVACCGGWT